MTCAVMPILRRFQPTARAGPPNSPYSGTHITPFGNRPTSSPTLTHLHASEPRRHQDNGAPLGTCLQKFSTYLTNSLENLLSKLAVLALFLFAFSSARADELIVNGG